MGNFDSAKKDWSKALDYYNQNGGNQDVTRFISRKLATIEASLNELEVKKD